MGERLDSAGGGSGMNIVGRTVVGFACVLGIALLGASPATAVPTSGGLEADVDVLNIGGVAPGRPGLGEVRLSNSAEVPLTVNAVTRSSGALVREGNLILEVGSCDREWVDGVCEGEATKVVTALPKSPAGVVATPFTLEPGEHAFLRVQVSLPDDADNRAQNLAAALSFTWTATVAGPVGSAELPETGPAALIGVGTVAGLFVVLGASLVVAARKSIGRRDLLC